MKHVLMVLGACSLFGCTGMRWQPAETVMLKGFEVYPGHHCESSAMLNLLRHQGYDISETQLIGAGSAPGFMLDNTTFLFLGGRNYLMKENIARTTGIIWASGSREQYGDGWDKIHALLRDGTPVVLRVDMRYLPYLYGGKYGPKYMSFGWHMVCLAGIDAEKETAYVTDTEHTGLREIRLADLHRARFSDTKVFPPNGEFYWTEKTDPAITLDWERIAEESLAETARSMEEDESKGAFLIGLDGLSKWPDTLAGFDERIPPYMLSQVLAFHYGCIETNGTGGAAFRKMYHAFLKETGKETGNTFIIGAARRLEPAVGMWKDLALGMKALSEDRSALKDKQRRKAALSAMADVAEAIYRTERDFYEYIDQGAMPNGQD